jgi:hypothetical protein
MGLNRGMRNPSVKIVLDGGDGTTHVYNDKGAEVHGVREITVTHKVGEPPKAVLTLLEVQGEINAEVIALSRELVPPLRLEESVQLVVGEPQRHLGRMRSKYTLTRFTPLPTWGTRTTLIAKGWMRPVGPLTIERVQK